MNHTPTPWECQKGNWSYGIQETNIVKGEKQIVSLLNEANAAFIVTACNAHQDLVKTVQEALEYAKLRGNLHMIEIFRKALAKVGVNGK